MGIETASEMKSTEDVEQAPVDVNIGNITDARAPVLEAADLYGDVQVAENLGHVHRGRVLSSIFGACD